MTDSQPTVPVPGPGASPETTEQAGSAGPARRPHRPSTIIWGFVVAVVGAGILARAVGAEFDDGLAVIVLLGAAGLALVGTSIASVVRRR
ncbi:hypothetical protein [Sanguibacter antarcticus]|uniref:Uncharacterized protein n=1 Tax=Sanguibacter antarcticus TaxID=372484 RepID=A0A2A9E508_9MICO|nr:hypothetical protein [Sanguibacter antarcticus]PFG33933.1 hypothetical protein ATL42_1832 [Sanguibacter antarcticus]